MPDFLKKTIANIKNIAGKLTLPQKLIGVGVLIAAIIFIVVIFSLNSTSAGTPLFTKEVDFTDMGKITKKLQDKKIPFSVKNNTIILVKDKKTKNRAIMMLAQEGALPKGKYNFIDIIKNHSFVTSKFENNIKFRAAIEGKLEELLRSSELIDSADVNFTMPEQTIWKEERSPVKVAVMLTPAWNVNLHDNKKAIKGIEALIVNSIDRATHDNVTITDNYGVVLNDFTDEEDIADLRKTKENLKIREQQITKYKNKIYSAITGMIDPDRVSVVVDVQMNFDKSKENRTEVLPVVLKEDDPNTPYDDGERAYKITESEKSTNEKFKGPNWIPEGPPGFDENVPPAYQGALEQMTEYVKDETIKNYISGESKKEIIKDPWDISKITSSVLIDGTWKIKYNDKKQPIVLEDGTREREYIQVNPKLIKKMKGFVEQAIGYSVKRDDQVSVYEFPKDRTKEFALIDKKWRQAKQTKFALIAGLIAILVLIIFTIIYRLIAKELERRKRLREEELARQHQLAREMALKSAEEDAVESEMSLEDKARLEMQENAINLSREHPEDVAQLIRTWLTEK